MWKKVVGYGLLSVVGLVALALAYLFLKQPARRPAPNLKVEITPARLARGKYIWTLSDCDGCHSQHEDKSLAIVEPGRGRGNIFHSSEMKTPIVVPNITPDKESGIGTWTDGEKVRAIREGVDKDGRTLFPMMPYGSFRHMSDEDVYSLVAYMNSLPPVRNPLPKMKVPFPMAQLVKFAPEPLEGPVAEPDRSNDTSYGRYLVALANCIECHTPGGFGGPDMGKRFSGGNRMEIEGHVVVSANITPDPQTGIGNWSPQYFKQRIYMYKNSYPDHFTFMPWHNFAQLNERDLEAIYAYLREQRPIENRVNSFPTEVAQASH